MKVTAVCYLFDLGFDSNFRNENLTKIKQFNCFCNKIKILSR